MSNTESMSRKIIGIGLVAVVCIVASFAVRGLISEREGRHMEAEREVAEMWGLPQTILGPVLIFKHPLRDDETVPDKTYVLPKTLTIESNLEPEVRSRGIFDTIVYTEHVSVNGTFSTDDINVHALLPHPTLMVSIADTRSIEEQVSLIWNDVEIDFRPGTSVRFFDESGIHAEVPFGRANSEYAFSFTLSIKGSDRALFTPVGEETTVTATSPWQSPEFVGAYLPSTRTIDDNGFSATWNVSSFGRSYPQVWQTSDHVSKESLTSSAFGVGLYEGVDLYTQVFRSVQYAVLFILITFTAFFLFEALTKIRIHPIQYLLVGAALALFYLLLLSMTEHFGFLVAYIVATVMTIVLITTYSISVLKQGTRAGQVFLILLALYSYMYFVLKLEDFALLFGSALVFVLLASVMYLTRKIDWFGPIKSGDNQGGVIKHKH